MEKFVLLGTAVNAVAIVLGAVIGLFVHILSKRAKNEEEGKRPLGKGLSDALMIGLALCCLLIGVKGAIETENILVVILSIMIGAVIGTLLDLDGKIVRLGDFIGKKIVEEAGEIWIASEYEGKERTAEEISQLLYHLQVMMIDRGLELEDIYKYL